MRKFLSGTVFLIILSLFFPTPCLGKVWINEFVANPISGENEWVELFNDGVKQSLKDWKLKDENNNVELLTDLGDIATGEYKVFTYPYGDGWLNNGGDGDKVILENSEGFEDSYKYSQANENESIGRSPDGSPNWTVFTKEKITKGDTNYVAPSNTPTLTTTQVPSGEPTSSPTDQPEPKDYDDIYILEVMPNPETGDEWVELYNLNDFEVNLVDWYIDDEEGVNDPEKFSATIGANDFYIFKTSSFFNNDGDDVRLLNHNKKEKDFRSYDYSEEGLSWAEVYGSWCQAEPSKGKKNEDCWQSEQPTETSTPTSTPEKTETPTLTPTEELTPTPTIDQTPTPELTPSSMLLPSPTPENDLLGLEDSEKNNDLGPGEVLGKKKEVNQNKKNKMIAGGFIGLGGLLLGGASLSPQIKKFFDKMKHREKD